MPIFVWPESKAQTSECQLSVCERERECKCVNMWMFT